MKKQIMLLGMFALIFWACQQPSKVVIKESGPEIDNMNKYIEAYVNADWATLRASYADTATIQFNNQKMDPDSLIRVHQSGRPLYDKVAVSTAATEYIKYENGQEWIHWWGSIEFTIKGTGKVIGMPIHMAGRLSNGKTTEQYAYYNTMEIRNAVLEANPPPAVPTK